ncbi:MAG: 2-oxo acid dehydrogenase subunit E2 [Phycisphaerales bacterium]|jgi:pyruvate dehydrogenase E2 component (dihydrolipoamide acetyltransferase)|nr:2-oxo acid dehydrogenase subunit E2 [Phycisphaerales bacterium]
MPAEITMPQLSDTMSDGTLVKWHKKEGDKIKAGDEIADVETDKATMPMEAFESGTLAVIAVSEGQKVKVGDRLAVIATSGEDVEQIRQQFAGGVASASAGQSAAPKTKIATEVAAVVEHPSKSTAQPSATAVLAAPASSDGGHRIRISPLARKVAADKGVDLEHVRGTGPNGRIILRDIQQAGGNGSAKVPVAEAAAAATTESLPARVASGQKQVIPLTKIRSVIAQRLQQSKQTIPHFYETIDIDLESVTQIRGRLNQQLEAEKVRLSIGDFISKAIASTLLQHPELNATFNGTEITRHGDVNLGMAVALPSGLIVPVLRNINQMGLKEIRQRSADLIDRARQQKLKQDEMTGATFTVSNLGIYGVREFSAIINPPEVGILAVAAAEKRPVVRNDQIVARTMLTVTLSADHRVIDGSTAADFLRTLKNLLEEPAMMLV